MCGRRFSREARERSSRASAAPSPKAPSCKPNPVRTSFRRPTNPPPSRRAAMRRGSKRASFTRKRTPRGRRSSFRCRRRTSRVARTSGTAPRIRRWTSSRVTTGCSVRTRRGYPAKTTPRSRRRPCSSASSRKKASRATDSGASNFSNAPGSGANCTATRSTNRFVRSASAPTGSAIASRWTRVSRPPSRACSWSFTARA